jgi:hemerythrin-like domain-containing protein
MSHDPDGPADTAMMGIVHDALRRDLRRTRAALDTDPGPRRRALADHIAWMMEFLTAHHGGEDSGLYPLVRRTDPGAAALLDEMDADHRRVHPAMDVLAAAAEHWGRTGEGRDKVVAALDDLTAVLLPHLDREESEAMPLVSRTITRRQWHDWDQAHNIRPKSLPVLAEEGNWLLDGLDAPRQRIVEQEVGLVPRLIVKHVFGPGYRRHARARWGA